MLGMFSILRSQRKLGCLSILPLGGSVVVVHAISASGEKSSIVFLEEFAAPAGFLDALQRLRISLRLASYTCTTLMAAAQCSLTSLEAPPVPREERKEALRWALKDVVSYPVDSACIDVLDMPSEGLPTGRPAGVLVVSASESAVRECVAPFVAAKVRLDVVDVPELAQRNVAALLADENRGLVFLRLDESGMMLTLTFHGELVAVRRSEMSVVQLMSDDLGLRERAMERLLLELQRSLDNFDRQYSHIPVSKVVVASFPLVPALVDELGRGTYVPVVLMDLGSVLDFSTVLSLRDPETQAKYLLPIGAALRTGDAG